MSQEVLEEVFQAVAETAPHISSGMLHRREYVGDDNPSNEEQLEADVWANEILKEKITSIEGVGEYASEEEHEVTDGGEGVSVTVDPLDGSSNIPSNNLVGIIVGVYDDELPCSGEHIVGSFYVVFGPLTTAILADESGVHEYVLEELSGDRVELHRVSEQMSLNEPKIYGFGGRDPDWTDEFSEFADEIRDELKLRYGGAFVGDVNQIIHYGGIFAYPELKSAPQGKLRLVFEGIPVGNIIEKMGGKSSNGEKSLLEVEPSGLHERTPLYLGNKELITRLEKL
jgi:fructose-1,6-bisphosphatase I